MEKRLGQLCTDYEAPDFGGLVKCIETEDSEHVGEKISLAFLARGEGVSGEAV